VIKLIQKFKTQITRFRRAQKLGIIFFRNKTFDAPTSIRMGNQTYSLSLPKERGVSELFRDIILDDEYWLQHITQSANQYNSRYRCKCRIFCDCSNNCVPPCRNPLVEPNADNIRHLNNQAESLGLKTFKEAVSNIDGTCSLSKSTIHDTSARITNCECGEIPLTSLHKVLNRFESQQIDLLKLDCEGSEFEILKDSTNLRKCKFITLEYHIVKDEQLECLKTLLSNAGFNIIHTDKHNNSLGNILAERSLA
jgi:FkbM family methyltransferase